MNLTLFFCMLGGFLLFLYVTYFRERERKEIEDIEEEKIKEKEIKDIQIIPVYIYLLCYNEEYLIENTILHYRNKFPKCVITVMDNYSSDRSVEIAMKYNCFIYYWDNPKEKGKISEHMYRHLKNNLWKERRDEQSAWIITCDMDEWLEIDQQQLIEEDKKGTTILRTYGINIVGNSIREDLTDINLFDLNTGYHDKTYSKTICFKIPDIKEINFDIGSHTSNPYGNVKYSNNPYVMKHMNYLGLNYLIYKLQGRFKRLSRENIQNNWGAQYTNNVENIKSQYQNAVQKIEKIEKMVNKWMD